MGKDKSFFDIMSGAVMPKNYRGVLVDRVEGGYMCLGRYCKNQEHVDRTIDSALDTVQKTIIHESTGKLH